MTAPIRNITLMGAPLSCALAAAMIAARLPAGACYLDVVLTGSDVKDIIYSRPDIRHVHQLLQITEGELRQKAGAQMVMALPYRSGSKGIIQAPLGAYGMPRRGCEFQHYWRRAFAVSKAQDMKHYNLALRLHDAGYVIADTPPDLPILDPAYKFDTKAYGRLLMAIARETAPLNIYNNKDVVLKAGQHGIYNLELSGQNYSADLILDMRIESKPQNKWMMNYLPIDIDDHLPGVLLHQVKTAIERLFSLWPDTAYNAAEPREYNRLTAEHIAHIDDMRALLSGDEKLALRRERIRRKINLFQSRGRLPLEDYDVFTKAEWISVLRGVGVMQMGYDRLADRESISDIQLWLETLSLNIDRQIMALKGGVR